MREKGAGGRRMVSRGCGGKGRERSRKRSVEDRRELMGGWDGGWGGGGQKEKGSEEGEGEGMRGRKKVK